MADLPSYGYMPGAYMNVPSNVPAGIDTPISTAPLYTTDSRGEFSKGIGNGWENLKSMGYGAAGLGADLVGADNAAQYLYGKALEKQNIAATQYAPAVANFTDIATPGNLYDWFLSSAGQALPSSAASLVTGGIGAKLFQSLAGKLVTNQLAQAAVKGLAEKYLAEGIATTAEKATELAVKKYFGAELGAYAGTMASSTAMESSQNWMDDVQKYGFKGTNPVKDLLFGAAGGAVEAGIGPERRLIGKMVAEKTAEEMSKAAGRGIVKNIGVELGKSMAGEGSEEFVQQMLQQAATMRNASLSDMLYDKQDWKDNLNAGMGGAAGGVLFGIAGGTKDYLGSRGYKTPSAIVEGTVSPDRAAPIAVTPTTKSDAVKQEQTTSQTILANTIKDSVQQFDTKHQELTQQKNVLLNKIWEVNNDPKLEQSIKDQNVNDLTTQFMKASAQQSAIQQQRADYMKGATAFAEKTNKKYESEWLKATAQEQDSIPTDEQTIFAQSVAAGKKAEAQGLIDARARNEAAKANTRIEQHQIAIANITNEMNAARDRGGVIDLSQTDLVKWHEKQIEDERKFLKGIDTAHANASKDSIGANDLFNLYRDKDYAINQIAGKYNVAAEAVQQAAQDSSKTAQDGPTTLRNRLGALRTTKTMADGYAEANLHGTLADRLRKRSSALAENAGQQMVIDMAIQRDINNGVLPTVLPYNERSTQVAANPAAPVYTREGAANPQQMLANRDAIRQRLTNWNPMSEENKTGVTGAVPTVKEVQDARAYLNQVKAAKLAANITAHAMNEHSELIDNATTKTSLNPNEGRDFVLKRSVNSAIARTLNKLPALSDKVKIISTSEITQLPKYVQDEYKGGRGITDLRTGTIYLVADKLLNKAVAVRTLLHESVAHFGLRSIMNEAQLDKFMNMVARDFVGTDSWEELKSKYPDYDAVKLAEEYVARYAEQISIDNKTGKIGFGKKNGPYQYTSDEAKTIYQRVRQFIGNILHDLGIIKLTDGDVRDTLLASVYNLANNKDVTMNTAADGRATMESRSAAPVGEFEDVRETRTYKDWLGASGNFLKSLTNKTNASIENGKVILSDTPTFREKAATAVADTYHAVSNLEELIKMAGGSIPTELSAYTKEKLSHNVISQQVGDFLTNVIGMDPQSYSAVPKEGTLFWKMMRAADGVTIPSSPKQTLEVFGKIAQAYHAEEANRALALKSIDKVQLARTESKIAALEETKASGKLKVEDAAKLEQQLSDAKSLRERILSPRQDLYGMSNEEAASIKKQYINEKNALQVQEIMQDIQKVNKEIMDKAVANGLLDPKLRKLWDETYAYYVPNTKFQQELVKISPSYANSSRYTNFGLWELSKERKGTDTLGSNPIVSLALKMEDVIRVSEEKKVITSLFSMFDANKEMLSEVAEKDNRSEINKYSKSLKDIMSKADEILSGEKVNNARDVIKGLRKRIIELSVEQVKEQNKLLKSVSDETKAKHDVEISRIEKDIQSAKDAMAVVKDQITQAKNNPDYVSLQQQAKDIIAARKNLYDERGYSRYINEDGIIKWKKNPSKFTGQMDHVITGFDASGDKVRYLIKNDSLLAALRGTHMFKSEAVIKFLGHTQRIMAQMMTTFSPAFVAVNFFRDWLTANVHIRHLASDLEGLGIGANELSKRYNGKVLDSLKHIYADARTGEIKDQYWAEKYADYQKYGGYTSMYNLGNWASSEKMMIHALSRTQDGISDKASAKKALYATMNWMQDASGAVENSNRLAAFATLTDALQQAGMSKEEANIKAADAALDLTVNFTKKGTWGPILSSLFLFSQASINSTLRIAKAMFPAADKGKPFISMKGWKDQRRVVRYGAGLMGLAVIMSSLARGIGGTDDDGVSFYDKLPDYIKTTNLVIPIGRNTFIKLPMAFGYAVPYTLGIVASDIMSGRQGALKGASTIYDSSMQNFFIVGGGNEGVTALTPTLFKPLVQIYANKNFFGGKVLPEQKSWEKGEKPDSQLAWKTTSPMFKLIAETINTITGGTKDRSGLVDISPASMEYAFKQYLGGVGDFSSKVANLTSAAMFGKTKEIDYSDIPIISRFAVQSSYPNTLNEYGKIKAEIETQLNEFNRAKTEMYSPSQLAEVYKNTQAGRLIASKLGILNKQMAATSKLENKAMNNPNIPEETKYNMRQTNEDKNEVLIKQFIKAAHTVGINPK
jgi:hypothetical protein